MPKDGWKRRFEDPIITPDGETLRTLRDAIKYLGRTVAKAEYGHEAVTTASTILTQSAEGGPAWMFMARMATLKAIHRHDPPPPFNPDFKEPHWGKRPLKRDQ
ncbi:MAG: hypothetical protein J0H42_04090 [Rhizobiales bacterium]|nr:hypothetical protein [Hyphomicrobiales bacterium]